MFGITSVGYIVIASTITATSLFFGARLLFLEHKYRQNIKKRHIKFMECVKNTKDIKKIKLCFKQKGD